MHRQERAAVTARPIDWQRNRKRCTIMIFAGGRRRFATLLTAAKPASIACQRTGLKNLTVGKLGDNPPRKKDNRWSDATFVTHRRPERQNGPILRLHSVPRSVPGGLLTAAGRGPPPAGRYNATTKLSCLHNFFTCFFVSCLSDAGNVDFWISVSMQAEFIVGD